jgi:glutamate/tyrosine decarboxylase-like PLP-dependent enzyme
VPSIIIAGATAHASVHSAAMIMGCQLVVAGSPDRPLTADDVHRALDPLDRDQVVAVVACAGATNTGAIDRLDEIAQLCATRGVWLHVDAAYGGAAMLSASARDKFRGIESADSVTIDPHKWLFTPFDCCALLYRQPELARATHTQDASYLDVIHVSDGEWNPTDYAYHLTRRARGLPLWFSLAVNGVDAYREAIEVAASLARQTARLISRTPHLELVREPDLAVVLFRRTGWQAADYDAWAQRLHADGVAFIPPTKWEGETVGRFAFLHPDTTMDLVREVLGRTE